MNYENLSISELKPAERNARRHQEKDIEAIKKSIQEFGFNDPIGVWGPENTIVEGHGRLQAASELGMEEVPVVHLDHLTDEQRRAYALAHNRTAELSEWDLEVMDAELSEIFDIDMDAFGFDEFGPEEASTTSRRTTSKSKSRRNPGPSAETYGSSENTGSFAETPQSLRKLRNFWGGARQTSC